jgi:hypothetical protein
MKKSMILLSLGVLVCLPAWGQAQARGRLGYRFVTNKAQITGVTNPERCLVPTGCTEDTPQDGPRLSGLLATPLGMPIPDNAFHRVPTIWSYQQLPGDCVSVGTSGAYATVFDSDFVTTQGSDRLMIVLNGQAVILGGNTVSFSDSLFLKCTVTQGSITTACPATANEPAIVQQINTIPTRAAQLIFFSYAGSLQVAKNTATNVKIEVSSFGTAGEICFASLMNGF